MPRGADKSAARGALRVFNRYIAQLTGDYKDPLHAGGDADALVLRARLEALEAQRMNLTATQYLRRKRRVEGAKKRGPKGRDLRQRFLDALPVLCAREGWTAADLRALGVPHRDLVEAGLRRPRGPRPKGPGRKDAAPRASN